MNDGVSDKRKTTCWGQVRRKGAGRCGEAVARNVNTHTHTHIHTHTHAHTYTYTSLCLCSWAPRPATGGDGANCTVPRPAKPQAPAVHLCIHVCANPGRDARAGKAAVPASAPFRGAHGGAGIPDHPSIHAPPRAPHACASATIETHRASIPCPISPPAQQQ